MLDTAYIFLTYSVLIAVFIAFCMERTGPHIIAMTGMATLLACGALSTQGMLDVFSSSAPLTIACMFVISAALDQAGVIDALGRQILRFSGENSLRGIFALLFLVFVTSAFMNNTPVVIILTPVMAEIARKLGHYPTQHLIPLSFFAIMGGTCTLIGTSTNILVNSVAQDHGLDSFHIFEISAPALLMALAGTIFMALFGRFLLPQRDMPREKITSAADIEPRDFFTEAVVSESAPFIGQTIKETHFTGEDGDYEVLDLVRKETDNKKGVQNTLLSFFGTLSKSGQDKTQNRPLSALRDIELQPGDRLIFRVDGNTLPHLREADGLSFAPWDEGRDVEEEQEREKPAMAAQRSRLEEAVIPHNSPLIGRRISSLPFRRNYGSFITGVHRRNENITGERLGDIRLRAGDTLVIEGPRDGLDRFFREEQVHSSSQAREKDLDPLRAMLSLGAIIGVVGLSALGVMPIAGLAMIGAVFVLISGCVSPDKAYRTIDWRILLLIFGMLGIGTAMEETGAAMLLVDALLSLVRDLGPVAILAGVYLLTSILTETVTNNAVAILLTPIIIGITETMGLNPTPYLIAVMLASSASFATPIGYQTNTYVYAAGGYKFRDFLKVGLPMNLLMWAVATTVIPLIWPLHSGG